jgi:hypothetical protein
VPSLVTSGFLVNFAFKGCLRILIALHVVFVKMLLHQGFIKLKERMGTLKASSPVAALKTRRPLVRPGINIFYWRLRINGYNCIFTGIDILSRLIYT